MASLAPVERLLAAVPPASGAVVMGTGIVSIDLTVDGRENLSRILLALTAAIWLALGLLVAGRVLVDRPRARVEAASPASLTGVAGTAVLGARVALLGWTHVAAALLAIASCVWLALAPRVLRRWTTPTVGVSFVLAVSVESLAVLAAVIAALDRLRWLALVALGLLALGLLAYVFVLARFDVRQLLTGRGDHWVAGGALAIAALACGRAAEAARSLGSLHGIADGLGVTALAVWAAAVAWLPALLAAELARPRLAYDARRWSTVFPFGMYAACSFVVGDVEGVGGIRHFAAVWIWVALAVWLVVFVALLRRATRLWRAQRTAA